MTVLFYDPLFLEHETGSHPENPGRLRAIAARLEQEGLEKKCRAGIYKPLTVAEVRQIHDNSMLERVQNVCREGGGYLDADTVVCPASYQVALAAAGACVAAVDAVMTGPERTALCLVRPPGHHATADHSMGFCLFNNIALAAQHARRAHQLRRIMIVDWDVHHGNGTQDIFYAEPDVLFYSIHRYGNGFYPGTGAADETGTGHGLGTTVNVPIRYGIARPDYRGAFRNTLEKAAADMKPDLVLLSAGFDAHHADPIGSLGLESEDFTFLTRVVLDIAKTHASGRLVSCLEGGYNLDALAESVAAHLEALLKEPPGL